MTSRGRINSNNGVERTKATAPRRQTRAPTNEEAEQVHREEVLTPQLRDAIATEVTKVLKMTLPTILACNRTINKEKTRQKTNEKGIIQCRKCGKYHSAECRFGTNTCYRCGQVGHIFLNCLERTRCFECGELGHLRRNCPKLRNKEPEPLAMVVWSGGETSGAKDTPHMGTSEEARILPDAVSGTFC